MKKDHRIVRKTRYAVLLLIVLQFGLLSQQTYAPQEVRAQTSVITMLHEAEDSVRTGTVTTGYDATAATTYIEFGTQSVVPPTPPPDTHFQPTAPYYTTFYYPWYQTPKTDGRWSYWQDSGNNPPATWFGHFLPDKDPSKFDPATELYSSNDISDLYWQFTKMAEAKLEIAVSSWWGQGHKTDTTFAHIVTDVMNRSDNPYPNLRWTLYYEPEGYGDPSPSEIAADLNYIAENYGNQPGFLKIDGRPVIFVWASGSDGAGMAARWAEANQQATQQFHIVLKLFSGFRDLSPQPDSWHQYGPASRYSEHAPYSSVVSPGFWLDDGSSPRLSRNLAEFRSSVVDMVAADAMWKIVTTWNEWGEGTSIEPAEQVRFNASTGRDEPDPDAPPFKNAYIDILNELLPGLEQSPNTVGLAVMMSSSPNLASATTAFSFGAGGDHGANSSSTASLDLLAGSGTDFYLAVGDMSYNNITPESAWCDYVKQHVGAEYPFEVLVGNHEDRVGDDGFIDNFAACLPDRLGATGSYAHRYYFDYPSSSPLARVIMIDPNMYRGSSRVEYCKDGETTECNWLKARIDEAKAAGLWVIVGMHKNCITMGVKSCEIGTELLDLLADKKVDIVLQGHEHNYQRSKQLALGAGCSTVAINAYDADCVVDDGADGLYTKDQGTIIVVAGAFGASPYTVDTGDPEAGYFASYMGPNTEASSGFVKVDVSQSVLHVQFMNAKGTFSDNFTISQQGTIPTPTPPGPTATATPVECPVVPQDVGSATATIDVPADGVYAIWNRVSVSKDVSSSFWLQIDDDCATSVGGATLAPQEWVWVNYRDASPANTVTVALSAGTHTVKLVQQGPDVRIDKLLLTTDQTCVPIGTDGAECLAATNTPPSVPTNLVATDVQPNRVNLHWDASTDDVAVTGYDIYRDGNLLSTIPATTAFQDVSVLPATAYSYHVYARDGNSNVSDASDPLSVTTPTDQTTVQNFAPLADAYVSSRHLTRNYGGSSSLRTDASPDVRSYLRFNVQGVTGTVTKATLRINARSSSNSGYRVHTVANNSWTEDAINYSTAPDFGDEIGSSGSVVRNTWSEVDVTSLVKGDGEISMALIGISKTGIALNSKESRSQPQLIIETLTDQLILDDRHPGTQSILPVGDAMVRTDYPDGNYGSGSTLRVDTSPKTQSYLRFDLSGLVGTVANATLRIYANSGSSVGYQVHPVADQTWDELSISFGSAPAIGEVIGSSGPISPDTWTTVDVTALVTGRSSVDFALTGLNKTSIPLDSREGANPPQLVVQTVADATMVAALAPTILPITMVEAEGQGGRDSDHDGLSDDDEIFNHTDRVNPDTDGDGLDDLWEVENGLSPLDPTGEQGAEGDMDQDGLTNLDEFTRGTDPSALDTDGDELPDYWEINYGFDPRQEHGANGANADTDHDDISNIDELTNNTSPLSADSDNDSLSDLWEIEYGIDPASNSGDDGVDGDPDADAATNGLEQMRQTDPRDSQDTDKYIELMNSVYLPQLSR